MTMPTVVGTHPASNPILALSSQFAERFQAEMERVAQVAMDAEPTLAVADGWRYDVLAGHYVHLAFSAPEAPTQPAPVATED